MGCVRVYAPVAVKICKILPHDGDLKADITKISQHFELKISNSGERFIKRDYAQQSSITFPDTLLRQLYSRAALGATSRQRVSRANARH